MYTIQNIRTKKFVYGTDFRRRSVLQNYHQRTSHEKMLTFEEISEAILEFRRRCCGKDYRIVELGKIEVKRILSDEKMQEYI